MNSAYTAQLRGTAALSCGDYSALSSPELVHVCVATGHPAAWSEFVSRFQPLIAGVVARAASRWLLVTAVVVDDLVQETYLKLCSEEFKRLREFESRHENAIYGYLKTLAYRVTLDHFKARHASKRDFVRQMGSYFDVVLRRERQRHSLERDILVRELEDLVGQVAETERDQLVFSLYYRQGLTASTIAQIPAIGLSTKGVESCLLRLSERLKRRVSAGARTGRVGVGRPFRRAKRTERRS